MKWSQLKARIIEHLADSVQKRFDFGITRYSNSYSMSRGWIRIDKKEVLNMSTIDYEYEVYKRLRIHPGEWEEKQIEVNEENIFSSHNLGSSLFDYLNLSIQEILVSKNPIIRAFGMLDSRIGKRRLQKIDIKDEHELVKKFFSLRCKAENLSNVSAAYNDDLTSPLAYDVSYKQSNTVSEENRTRAKKVLRQDNKTRNIKSLLRHLLNNDINEGDFEGDIPKEIYKAFRESSNPAFLCQSLQLLESQTKLFDDINYVRAILALIREHSQWIRSLDSWKPQTHNRKRQFSSLARHLWAKYDIPAFMDKAWPSGDPVKQGWFRDIGAGKNIRTSDNLPIPLTKKMAHYFMTAPENYSIEGAFRWGQVHALGGDQRIADALLETQIAEEFRDNDFWLSVIRFFIDNPMLDTAHFNPVIDYIWNQKYENQIVFVDRGVAQERGPAQPNFCMRGRTIDSLLRAVNEWHKRLGKETKSGNLQWKQSGIKEFQYIEGTEKSRNMRIWRIKELLNSQDLITEGRQMHHCVATYAKSCHSGKSSIWSMDVENDEGVEKLLTIEVHNTSKEIHQVRGIRNRLASDKEKEILRRWATKEELLVASYLF